MRRMLWCVLAILAGVAGAAAGQEGPAGGPMTYALARKANYVPLETLRETRSRIPAPLGRRVTIEREGVLLQQVLLDIANQAELGLSYGEDLVRARVVVSLSARNEMAADALQQVTDGTDWAVLVTPAGQVAVLRREPAQVGAIAGSVTDAKTGTALAGATVIVEGTSLSTTTGTDGHYRVGSVSPGTYTVRARFIGYAPGSASVTVGADQEVTANFPLEKSTQKLDELVTTGTVVPTEVKALPTPVTVITSNQVALSRPRTVNELFRQGTPGGVAYDYAAFPFQVQMSVRGASSLQIGSSGMKVYLDGLEVVDRNQAAVDPNSIDRIEILRGPQAAAIYGSDAIGGVMQIFTKRGESRPRPAVEAQAAAGLVQSPYGAFGTGSAVRQEYGGSVQGGGPTSTFYLGGGYTRMGEWVREGTQSVPSAYGGVRMLQGPLTVDLFGRYFAQNTHGNASPVAELTGFAPVSKPLHLPTRVTEQSYGTHLTYTASQAWRHNVTIGVDRLAQDAARTQPRLTTPGDTLLQVSTQNDAKVYLAYNTSLTVPLSSDLSANVVAGIDHYSRRSTSYLAFNASNTDGTIAVGQAGFQSATRDLLTNTGYFAQARLDVGEALFLTGGIRADNNSAFGSALGTPVSPRAGIAYARQLGPATLKLRGSYGEGIRAPGPEQRNARVGSFFTQVANPQLGPERQTGWDAGIDLAVGARGSLGITYYHQIARDLIQAVALDPVTSQYQNVGRIKNTGLEVEGTLSFGIVQLNAQYALSRSMVEDLGPGYTGDLRVGERPFVTPKHTGGAFLTVAPGTGTTIAAGLTFIGSWTYYDFLAQFSCFGGTAPCRPTPRDYLIAYPSVVKADISVWQQIARGVSGFISMRNLANEQAFEANNVSPILGRSTMAGLQVRY